VFDIRRDTDGNIVLKGRLDAVSAPTAREFLADVDGAARLDFSSLDYIASIGLGILVAAQRRLVDAGGGLVLAGLGPHLREILVLAGFEAIFEFE